MRRKPYFIAGWTIFVLCNAAVAIIGEPDLIQLVWLVGPLLRDSDEETVYRR
jgi:hypothetical protein